MRRADKEVKDLEQLEEILRACTADSVRPLRAGGAEGVRLPVGRGGGL